MPKPTHGTTHRISRSAGRESGMATGELLVLTVPMCVLAMAFASKLSSTASARTEGQWQMSLSAQQSATEPCPGNVDVRMTAPAMLALKHKKAITFTCITPAGCTTMVYKALNLTPAKTAVNPLRFTWAQVK